jgi:glyoxylase-like metal-dependent hydrolase (beta-lactamase superfamily II)
MPLIPPAALYPASTPEAIERHRHWLEPRLLDPATGLLVLGIHSYLIRSRNHTILVDACSGNDRPRPNKPRYHMKNWPFLENLARTGVAPEDVDFVLCTHLHVDHVGWNTRLVEGKWVPTFPNARYLFGRKEWEHWSSEHARHRDGDVMDDSVRPIIDAGLAELVDMHHVLTPEVRLEPTPGHTPGHVSVRISSRGEEAVITGDLMHHPLQCAEPDLANNFDVDAAAARRTRREFLARYSDTPVLVLGTHFAPPTGGWIVAAAQAWRFDLTPPADGGKP